MNSGGFDLTTTLIVVGIIIVVALILTLLLLFARRRQSIKSDAGRDARGDPYAVDKQRPYMPPADPPPPAPAPEPDLDISQPVVALPGDFVGIAFPPHATDHPDPLTRLKGVGPKMETLLNEQGVTRYEQLASLDDSALAALEERMGAFKGRLTRDRVVEQARLLASGDTAGFEEKFGKLGS